MLANTLIFVVAAIHIYILILEMFLWESPSASFARETRVMAANQGLYNGFLAAGLLWGLWSPESGFEFKAFFLICVVIAGLFGAATASRKILYVQALPATVALIALYVS